MVVARVVTGGVQCNRDASENHSQNRAIDGVQQISVAKNCRQLDSQITQIKFNLCNLRMAYGKMRAWLNC
jgi:hypothetical protein